MPSPSPSKPATRALAKQALAALTEDRRAAASLEICGLAAASDQYTRAKSILFYYPIPPEVDVLPLARRARADNKQICFPRIDWDAHTMQPVAVDSLDPANFETRRHNIPEPLSSTHPTVNDPPPIDLIIIPGLAFDPAANRLGRGAGYYDRFLASCPATPTLGVCFACQLLPQIPTEPHDIPMQSLITESGLIPHPPSGPPL